MTITELRSKRVAAEVPAVLLAKHAKINRTRLSFIECGHMQATEDELNRIETALDELIRAKAHVEQVAASVGWPRELI